MIDIEVAKSHKRGVKPNYYRILLKSLFWLYYNDFLFGIFVAFVGESASVFYSYFIGDIIKFL